MVKNRKNSAKTLNSKKITLLLGFALLMLSQTVFLPTLSIENKSEISVQSEQEQSEQPNDSTQHFWYAQSAQQLNGSTQLFWNLSFAFTDFALPTSLNLAQHCKQKVSGQTSYFKVLFNFIISPNAP